MQKIQAKNIFDYPKYWAIDYGVSKFLPTSRKEMDALGWDSCDIILISGDAYVDLPSFGMAIIGRILESQGFRVGIISQPNWHNKKDFMQLGRPNLFFGVTSGNMDSMINRYTSDKKIRHDDAYTPNNEGGKRPDRAVIVYSQRCREAYKDIPIIIGSIEASLRRVAHYDYWSNKIRRSIIFDSKADLLLFGNAERALIEIAHQLANGVDVQDIHFIRGSARIYNELPSGFKCVDSSIIDRAGKIDKLTNPYFPINEKSCKSNLKKEKEISKNTYKVELQANVQTNAVDSSIVQNIPLSYVLLPSFSKIKNDKILYAHASRCLHKEANPYSARSLVQEHDGRFLWVNPPPIPLTTPELDYVYELPYSRLPHPKYNGAKIPAYEMIKTSINIMRGCFGGCSFCSITEHEGKIIQSRSKESILNEIKDIRDKLPKFNGIISDLGGPSANMYRLGCKDPRAEAVCKKPSCIFPKICKKLNTDHSHLIDLYRSARSIKGIKKVFIASGVRYDLALESPEYIKELLTHHVGGYLKIAPEHTETRSLDLMQKPSIDTYHDFKIMFDNYSSAAHKKQFIIPYFISAHPGSDIEEMINLAIWLKKHNFKCDQVQNFYPTPMSSSTAMYYSEINALKNVDYKHPEKVYIAKGDRERRIQKAFLRYHDPKNWALLRETLRKMGKAHLIGTRPDCLVPPNDYKDHSNSNQPRQKKSGRHGANRFNKNRGQNRNNAK